MDSDTLCDYCDSIDFQSTGLCGADFDDRSMFALDERPLAEVLQTASSCYFCRKMSDFFTRWIRRKLDDPVELHLEGSRVTIGALRLRSVDLDETGRSKGHLLRISASCFIRKPSPAKGWYGPEMNLQRCGQNPIHVSDFCQDISPFSMPADEPYNGRIRPLVAETRLFCKWKDCCKVFHGENCGQKYPGDRPSRLRLIDIEQRCVVERLPEEGWVALSYVWGKAKVLQSTKDTLSQLQQQGSLRSEILPRTIDDAIEITRRLGLRYLWVDSLCIVQDDDADKLEFIPQMASIYGLAEITIICSSGLSADAGLPGIQSTPRHQVQVPFTIKGVSLMETLDPVGSGDHASYLGESFWNTRGWTFQERLFSGKALIFTPEQVYWECEKASWCEDSFWEHEGAPTIYRHSFDAEEFRNIWEVTNLDDFEEIYRKLVEEYSLRHLSFESDGLNAFAGILEAFEKTTRQKFFWGLPAALLGSALSWPSERGRISRRKASCQIISSNGTPISCLFPSWSWVGWVGDIIFAQLFGKLTSRTPGLVFYNLDPDGQPRIMPQESKFSEPKLRPSVKRNRSVSPTWKDESKWEIIRADIPEMVFMRGMEPTILCFWSSTAVLHVKHGAGDHFGTPVPLLSHNGSPIAGLWNHVPQCESGLEEFTKFIVIARDSLELQRNNDQLAVILSGSEDGVYYRRGLVSINETEWIALDNRAWELIILG